MPNALVGLWSSLGLLFQDDMDLNTPEDRKRYVIWWLQHGKHLHTGLSAEITDSLLNAMHAFDYSNGLTYKVVTPLMKIVYESRSDLQQLYPRLSDAVYGKGFWQWWYLHGRRELKLPNDGFPLPIGKFETSEIGRVCLTIQHLLEVVGEQVPKPIDSSTEEDDLLYWWIARGRLIYTELDAWFAEIVSKSTHVADYFKIMEGEGWKPTRLMSVVLNHRRDLYDALVGEDKNVKFWQWWRSYGGPDYGLKFCGLPHVHSWQSLREIFSIEVGYVTVPVNPLLISLFAIENHDAKIDNLLSDASSVSRAKESLRKWLTETKLNRFDELLLPMFALEVSKDFIITENTLDELYALTGKDNLIKNPAIKSNNIKLHLTQIIAGLAENFIVRDIGEANSWWGQSGANLFPKTASMLGLLKSGQIKENDSKNNYVSQVQIIGYPGGQFGIGEDARLVYEAAKSTFKTVRLFQSKRKIGAEEYKYDEVEPIEAIGKGACNIFCMPAFDTLALIHDYGRRPFESGYRVGMWQWELETFPNQALSAFDLIDEIWTISRFCQNALSAATEKPVYVIPLPVKHHKSLGMTKRDFRLPEDSFVYLTVFDGSSFIARKNPLGVIEAFQRAFKNKEPVTLVIKSMKTSLRNDGLWRECLNRAASDKRIIVMDDVFSTGKLSSLFDVSDCIVSLHRAEGFGRIMADAFIHKKPVISSSYSGCMDFLTHENAYLVDGTLVDILPQDYPFYENSKWFNPDIDSAAARMREVFENRDEACNRALRGFELISTRYSIESASQFVQKRLINIMGV